MEELKEAKVFINKLTENRYKIIGKYKIDRFIANGAMLLIFAHLFLVAYTYNFNLDYYSCGGTNTGQTFIEGCKNPFYSEATEWKGQEYLAPGEYGFKPTAFFRSVYYMPVVFLFLAFVLNHMFFNRKYKFKMPEIKDDEVQNEKPRD